MDSFHHIFTFHLKLAPIVSLLVFLAHPVFISAMSPDWAVFHVFYSESYKRECFHLWYTVSVYLNHVDMKSPKLFFYMSKGIIVQLRCIWIKFHIYTMQSSETLLTQTPWVLNVTFWTALIQVPMSSVSLWYVVHGSVPCLAYFHSWNSTFHQIIRGGKTQNGSCSV